MIEINLSVSQRIPEGEGYRCFIALAENHTLGFARPSSDGVRLHLRDGDGLLIDEFDLTETECKEWKARLIEFASGS